MKTSEVLEFLDFETLTRFERVRNWFEPLPLNSEDFVINIKQAKSNASIADGRLGYIGNPYEQVLIDILRIEAEVEKVMEHVKQS